MHKKLLDAELVTLGREVALALGSGWAIGPQAVWYVHLVNREADQALSISTRRAGRVEISPVLLRQWNAQDLPNYCPRISCAAQRGALAIAGDIRRRLWSDALSFWDDCRANRAHRLDVRATLLDAIEELHEVGLEPSPYDYLDSGGAYRPSTRWRGRRVEAHVQVSGHNTGETLATRVNLTLHDLSVEEVLAVRNLLCSERPKGEMQ